MIGVKVEIVETTMDSKEIKELRLSLNLTQEGFARFLGVSLRSVAGWEAGRSRPRGLYLTKLQEIKRRRY